MDEQDGRRLNQGRSYAVGEFTSTLTLLLRGALSNAAFYYKIRIR